MTKLAAVLAFAIAAASAPPSVLAAATDAAQPTCVTYLPGVKLPTPPPNAPSVSSADVQAAIRAGTAAAQAAGVLAPATGRDAGPTIEQAISQAKALDGKLVTKCASTRTETLESPPPGGSTADAAAIYAAAMAFYGTNTSAKFGARGAWGVEACMLSVNEIIHNALGFYLANDTAYVPDGVNAILSGVGYKISQGNAGPGDIVVADGQGHIGICLDVGCHHVLSNSSSRGAFIWKSDSNFSPSYSGPSTFFRIK